MLNEGTVRHKQYNMELEFIDNTEYQTILRKDKLCIIDRFKLAQCPYRISLVNHCNATSFHEKKKIRQVEDENVRRFLNTINIVYGMSSEESSRAYHRLLSQEPLRSVVIMARQKENVSENGRIAYFMELSCLAILAADEKKKTLDDIFLPKLRGDIPRDFLTSRQEIGDEWFQGFVNHQLTGMKKVFESLGAEEAYKFLLHSTVTSLYYFTPSRYNLWSCRDINEAIVKILKDFCQITEK